MQGLAHFFKLWFNCAGMVIFLVAVGACPGVPSHAMGTQDSEAEPDAVPDDSVSDTDTDDGGSNPSDDDSGSVDDNSNDNTSDSDDDQDNGNQTSQPSSSPARLQSIVNANLQKLIAEIPAQDRPAITKNLGKFALQCSLKNPKQNICTQFISKANLYYVISAKVNPTSGICAIFNSQGQLVFKLVGSGAVQSISMRQFSAVDQPDVVVEHIVGSPGIYRTYQTVIKNVDNDRFQVIANVLVDKIDSKSITVAKRGAGPVQIHYTAYPYRFYTLRDGTNKVAFYVGNYSIDIPDEIQADPLAMSEVNAQLKELNLAGLIGQDVIVRLVWNPPSNNYALVAPLANHADLMVNEVSELS